MISLFRLTAFSASSPHFTSLLRCHPPSHLLHPTLCSFSSFIFNLSVTPHFASDETTFLKNFFYTFYTKTTPIIPCCPLLFHSLLVLVSKGLIGCLSPYHHRVQRLVIGWILLTCFPTFEKVIGLNMMMLNDLLVHPCFTNGSSSRMGVTKWAGQKVSIDFTALFSLARV